MRPTARGNAGGGHSAIGSPLPAIYKVLMLNGTARRAEAGQFAYTSG